MKSNEPSAYIGMSVMSTTPSTPAIIRSAVRCWRSARLRRYADRGADGANSSTRRTPSGRRKPASVIAERVGWVRGMTVFNERVRELRPAYQPPDPAGRTTYDAGDVAQCDLWFPPTTVPVG